ncbi:cyclic-phosphate processing receiver domain-containing protein [uncultured Streptococcus sp.]|uniref:cyclic-phosphate processing receiver domain-containing protein n=1 Tax=uncultured Streptococcus sp. TaxID=83427 RepID=UPI0027DDA238|nr:cyclic-phosphate processing receiver domain-containing protein [uncultured Streptococcus sp.]
MALPLKIFVDDERPYPVGYNKVYRDGESLLMFLRENKDVKISLLSLDHDLGEDKMDGYELVKQLVELNPNISKIRFHTSNIVGFHNMGNYLINAKKAGEATGIKEIVPNKWVVLGDGSEYEDRFIKLKTM